jgi:hypothetical protein
MQNKNGLVNSTSLRIPIQLFSVFSAKILSFQGSDALAL